MRWLGPLPRPATLRSPATADGIPTITTQFPAFLLQPDDMSDSSAAAKSKQGASTTDSFSLEDSVCSFECPVKE